MLDNREELQWSARAAVVFFSSKETSAEPLENAAVSSLAIEPQARIWQNLAVLDERIKSEQREVATVHVSDDEHFCPEVGRWAEDKHGLVSFYAKLFSTGMKDKWHERVYIELYAGAGHSRIRGTSTTIAGSPLQALSCSIHSTSTSSARRTPRISKH